MKNPLKVIRFATLLAGIVMASAAAGAGEAGHPASPAPAASAPAVGEPQAVTYKMQLIYIFEADHTEYIFAIGQSGFRSVAALKKFIASLPEGSVIEFQSTCRRTGDEPLISSDKELADFKDFCASHGIRFEWIPSG